MASRFRRFTEFSRRVFGNTPPVNLADPTRCTLGKQFVELESRSVPATFIVTNILDNQADAVGGLSLRQAINAANSNPGFDRIEFNIPRSPSLPTIPNDPIENYFPIVLASTLPDLTDPAGMIIDASTQPRNNATGTRPIVQLLPDPNPGAFPGQKGALFITGPNNTIRGFVITGFPGSAINITSPTASNNILVANWINTDITGTRPWNEDPFIVSARPPGTPVELTNTGPNENKFPLFVLGGITLTDGANSNIIGGLIDKNGTELATAGGTTLGVSATISRYNSKGVLVDTGIPITPAINRNIISGTPQYKKSYYDYSKGGQIFTREDDIAGAAVGPGIRLMDPGTNNNLIQGNFIGTDVTGNVPIPNHNGIEIFNAASSNYIGNPSNNFIGDPVQAGIGNLIRFNENDGVRSASIPNPSMISPPIPPNGPPPPYIEGDEFTTVTAPGAFGPFRANNLARIPFFDTYNPAYLEGLSPTGPDIITVVATARGFNPASKTTTADGVVNQSTGLEAQVGTKVRIQGNGFLSTTAVTFNSSPVATPSPQTVPGKFVVIDDANIDVIIPAGAVTPPAGIPGLNVFTPSGVTTNNDAGFIVTILPSPPAQIEIVSTFAPSSGLAGETVSVFGSGFTGAQSVTVGGITVTKYTVLPGGNQIDFIVPTGAQTGPITIITPGGSASSTRDFRVESQPPPIVTGVNKASAIPGEEITLTGVNFSGAHLIRFNFAGGSSGFATTNFIVDSPQQIRVKVPTLATPSTNPIQVVTNDGFGVSLTPLQIIAPPTPVIGGLNVTSGPIGQFVTITGSGFTSASRVTFSGLDAHSFTILNPNQIKAVVPFGISPGTISPVRVVSSGGTSVTPANFTITPSLQPTVDAIPLALRNNFTVVNGTNLFGTTKVLFGSAINGTPAVSFEVLSDTQIRVQIPVAAAPTGQFFVYTAFHTQNPLATPAQNTATIADNQFPVIGTGRQSDPISGIVSQVITLRGTGLLGTQQVLFQSGLGGTVQGNNLTILSDGEITFTVPQQAITGPITVVTPGTPDTDTPFSPAVPSQTTTIPFTLLVSPAPEITGSFPASGPVGTIITLSGKGFGGTVQVKIGGAVAEEFTVENDNVLKVRVSQLAQTGPVTVQTPGGIATSPGNFTVTASPVPTLDFSTPRAPRNTQVTISGSGLAGTSKVLFNDVAAQFRVISDTLLTAIVPLTAGPGEIRVFTPGGSVASPTPFTLGSIPVPVMTVAVGADAVPVGGSFVINGVNLEGNLLVSVTNLDTGVETPTTYDFADLGGSSVIVHMPEVDIGRYVVTVYSSNKNSQDSWNFPTPGGNQSGTRYDFSYSTGEGILGTKYEYGELMSVLPNARPRVNGVFANDGLITRGAPIYIRGSGFTGANRVEIKIFDNNNGTPLDPTDDVFRFRSIYNNFSVAADPNAKVFGDETLVFDGVQRFRVLSDNQIMLTLPQDLDKSTTAITDAIVKVYTPNGAAPADLTNGGAVLAASFDDLPSIQEDVNTKMTVAATTAFTFTASAGANYGSKVTLTATTGNFFGAISFTGDASDVYTGTNLGAGVPGHHTRPLSNPTFFRDFGQANLAFVQTQDVGIHPTFRIIPGSNGKQAELFIGTGFAKIPDPIVPPVPPGSPPGPPAVPAAFYNWTGTNLVGSATTPQTKLGRPDPGPAGGGTTSLLPGGAAGAFNRMFRTDGNLATISVGSIDIGGVGTITRDNIEVILSGQTVKMNYVMPAPAFFSNLWPSGSITVRTADGTASSSFGVAAQRVPQMFVFSVKDPAPQDNRFLANRIFGNGLTIQRDPTTSFITGVTPKAQATSTEDGNLGLDFVTLNPNGTRFPFDFGFARIDQGPANAPPAGNHGRGGINDGALNSFSLPSAKSYLPTDPLFTTNALPSGIGFDVTFPGDANTTFDGKNTFNNSQYGRYFGPNLLQNFPLLQEVQSSVDRTTFSTALLGKPFRSYRIDYYYNPGVDNGISDQNLDPFLSGQSPTFLGTRFDDQDPTARATTNIGAGQLYLGSKIITTDSVGDGSVSFAVFQRLPVDPNDPTSIPPLQPGEFQLPNNQPLVPTITDPVTGAITFRAGVVTATATDLTAPGPDGPILTAGPDGTSRFSFFKRVDTPTATISGRAIIDKNANGIIDPSESGVAGATVGLFVQREDGTYANTPINVQTITDEGSFFFGPGTTGGYGIANGKHKLALTLPTGAVTYFYETPADGILFPQIINGNTVSDQIFLVTTTPVNPNTPPTISDIGNQSVAVGGTAGPIAFTVGDLETPAANLTITFTSSNAAIVNPAAITIGGSGANRTITVPTVAGQNGASTITVTVTDGGGLTSQDTFVVNAGVPPLNTPPTISDIPSQDTVAGGTVGPINFTINDAETLPQNLVFTILSSNAGVVPISNVVITGTGTNRAVTVTTLAGSTGSANITIIITDDGGLSSQDSFTVTVPPPPGTVPALLAIGSDAGRTAQVKVYNPDGTFLYTLTPFGDGFTGGARVATGDVNGDGNADVVVAAGPGIGGLVKIYDGLTGTFLKQYLPYGEAFTGGVYVVTGDNDGDGIQDVITGTGKGGGPRVRIVQGGTSLALQTIADFFPYESSFRGGVLVAAGYVNGDKFADIVTGTGVRGGPRVRVLDGTRLQSDEFSPNPGAGTLYDFFAYDSAFRGGVFASVGDVDGDGVVEILTGTGVGGGPVVKIFKQSDLAPGAPTDIINGIPIFRASKSFFAYDPAFRGGVRIDSLDGNGDGIVDIVTAPGVGLPPEVRVINYASLQDLYRITAFEAGFNGGVFVGGNIG